MSHYSDFEDSRYDNNYTNRNGTYTYDTWLGPVEVYVRVDEDMLMDGEGPYYGAIIAFADNSEEYLDAQWSDSSDVLDYVEYWLGVES